MGGAVVRHALHSGHSDRRLGYRDGERAPELGVVGRSDDVIVLLGIGHVSDGGDLRISVVVPPRQRLRVDRGGGS